jgi:phosphopantetheinyl transferase
VNDGVEDATAALLGMEKPRLCARGVRIHVFSLDLEGRVADFLESLLDGDDWAYATRARRAEDRRKRILRRGARRYLLSQYTERSPDELSFARGSTGKPYLRDVVLDFNESSSGQLAAFAVARDCAVGVDVQQIVHGVDHESIVSLLTRDAVTASIANRWPAEDFFQWWCRVEASLKCMGVGFVAAPSDAPTWVADLAVPSAYRAAVAASTTPSVVELCVGGAEGGRFALDRSVG